ncbi:MAG: 3'(2'),5'-bisphosphate nucleotidase CysQ [Helicobacter sp.]|nr:3'(2'),5'-bisphosphate nucleotidase CysQ [Helicobacter sp.]
MENLSTQHLLYSIMQVAIKAGEIALKYHDLKSFTLKEDSSPLTQADLESNAFITQQLKILSPYEVCSEEAVLEYEERKDLEYYWLVDPLDGTKDFLAQNGGWTINIALINKNRPFLGVVYAPYFYELYGALKDFGSFSFTPKSLEEQIKTDMLSLEWLKSSKIKLNGDRVAQSEELIACDSMFHSTKETQDFIQKYGLKVLKKGSSLKICTLAKGEADFYPRLNGTKEWDTAASEIILEEAGGILLDCKTHKPLAYNKPNPQNNHFIAFAKSQVGGRIYQDLFSNKL